MGDKIIGGLSLHKEKLQVNSFKGGYLLLYMMRKIIHDSNTTPVLRIRDKELLI